VYSFVLPKIPSPLHCALVLVLGTLALVLPGGVVRVDGHGERHVPQGRHQLQGGQRAGVPEGTHLPRANHFHNYDGNFQNTFVNLGTTVPTF